MARIIGVVCSFVCVSARAVRRKRLELSTLVQRIVRGRYSACIDPEFKRVKGQGHRVIRCADTGDTGGTTFHLYRRAAAAEGTQSDTHTDTDVTLPSV